MAINNASASLESKSRFEDGLRLFFKSCALLSIIITFGIIVILLKDTLVFFGHVSPLEFLTGTSWSPTIKPEKFGILPLLSGTLVFTLITACISIPTGLMAALYLSEYVGSKKRAVIKPLLELLTGLPTVVYGYCALVYITPFLRRFFPEIQTFNVISAAIVVAIMIIPTIVTISEDAMKAVPRYLREASYALGANKYQTCVKVVIPSAVSGIVSSFILGISRAIGETMAVTIAAGNLARMVNPLDPAGAFLKPIQTMTAAMVEIGMSDVTGDSVAYKSLFAIGLTLFVMTLVMNTVSQYFKTRFREVYH